MLSTGEMRQVIERMDVNLLRRIYEALGRGRVFEAERILAEQSGDATASKETIASMVRNEWRRA